MYVRITYKNYHVNFIVAMVPLPTVPPPYKSLNCSCLGLIVYVPIYVGIYNNVTQQFGSFIRCMLLGKNQRKNDHNA